MNSILPQAKFNTNLKIERCPCGEKVDAIKSMAKPKVLKSLIEATHGMHRLFSTLINDRMACACNISRVHTRWRPYGLYLAQGHSIFSFM